ncbi:hypothetical protein [Polyangium sorediatum]|uniref:Lipoprotein n=1 Tax=Polyangium sorediatum TaxID=889274 RepID=A0ABT6NI27_9BACT|nr:hypothetical protein [Polyangium sorediatum]MDI1427962.1 hypothetical protein [Polyangium sorediatum]
MSKYAFIVASGLLASGCGLVNLQTNIPGLGGGGENTVGPFGILPYDEDEAGKAVLATFKSWDYTSCQGHMCVPDFKKQAGVKEYQDKATYIYLFNPRRTLKNPDPTWLTGWDKMPEDEKSNTADETYQALIVAAMRRTWLAKCYADYLAIDKEARALDAKWATEIADASKIPSPYGRISALLGLKDTAEKAASGNSYIDILTTRVGFQRDLRVAIKKAYDATERDYLYAVESSRMQGDDVRARLDAATERDMYCAFAASNGTSKTPELDSAAFGNSYTERGAKYVKPLFSEETLKKIDQLSEKESKKSADEVRPKAIDKVHISEVANGEKEMAGHPKLGHFETYEVTKVAQKDGKTELEIVYSYTTEYPYDCVETNRIHSIQNGRIVYREICKHGKHTRESTMRITLGEMPEGVTVQVGDKLTGYAFVKKHEKKKPTDTKALIKETELWELELHHLKSLERKKKLVGQWF